MQKIAYLLAKIDADTAENERHFAENLPQLANYPGGAGVHVRVVGPRGARVVGAGLRGPVGARRACAGKMSKIGKFC